MANRQYPGRPIAGVGAVVFLDNRILLVRRHNPPKQHTWTLPGGLVKLGETTKEAVTREVFEECAIIVKPLRLVEVLDFIEHDDAGEVRYHYVLIDYEAEFIDGTVRPGSDVSDVSWFSSTEIHDIDIPEMTKDFLHRHYAQSGFRTGSI